MKWKSSHHPYVIIVVLLMTFPISSSYAQSYYFSGKTFLGGGTVSTTFMDSILTYRARKKFSSVYNRFQTKPMGLHYCVLYAKYFIYKQKLFYDNNYPMKDFSGWSTIYTNHRERHLWKQNKIFLAVAISPRFVVKTLLYDSFYCIGTDVATLFCSG